MIMAMGKEVQQLHLMMMMMIYFSAVGLTSGGSSTFHVYTQTVHGLTQ
jgi:hypothetical protein